MMDDKGRLAFPAFLQEAAGAYPVLCRTVGHALLLLPAERWAVLAFSGPPAWRMLAGSGVGQVAWQGVMRDSESRRLLIPKPYREWAGLESGSEAVLEVMSAGGVLICEGRHFQAALSVANERLLELLERRG
jgi:DNA-binding transcriptional regulator/RsmH inhibitor MraZ